MKILLTAKVVKLFKLFSSENVHFVLGNDDIGNGIIQPKVSFYNDLVTISAILPNDSSLINSVPAELIRKTAFNQYDYSVNLNKDSILNAIKRFLIFTSDPTRRIVTLNFGQNLTICDDAGNSETIEYDNNETVDCDYSAKFFAEDLRLTLESVTDKFVVFNFGNHMAAVIAKGNIYNVVPEVVQNA